MSVVFSILYITFLEFIYSTWNMFIKTLPHFSPNFTNICQVDWTLRIFVKSFTSLRLLQSLFIQYEIYSLTLLFLYII